MSLSNGANGHTNGVTDIPVTKLFASFVADATPKQLTAEIREKIKEVIIDYVGVVVGGLNNAESSEPIYKAIVTLQGGSSGKCTVLGKGAPHMLPQYAGLVNSAFGHSMDYDDTHAESTLHAGITAISASLTQAEVLGEKATPDDVMIAIAVGYEVTCRIGCELGFFSYERGFHNTSIAGIFGAVASIASLKHLSAETIEMAFGFAGSKAAGSIQYLENGSHNKRLHPVRFAVHDAFMCIGLAEAGVIGATRSIEGKNGFLHGYTPNPNIDFHKLTSGLGTQWIWMTSSLKPFAGCRMTHVFIELSGNVNSAHKGKVSPDDVKAITLTMSPSCNKLIGDPIPNKIHPVNIIDAQFSSYFQAANALVHGATLDLKAYNRLLDKDVHAMCDKMTVKIDETMTGFSGKMHIEWADGTSEDLAQQFPLGEVQHPFTRDKVDEKFLSLAAPIYGKKKASQIIETIDHIEDYKVEDLLVLLR